MRSSKTQSFSVSRLRRLFDQKLFAVPELQREFVWNGKKACALMDSIYKNYPIGTAMVWRTDRSNRNLLRHKLHIPPHFDDRKNRSVYFLVDGQQRLSVLYNVAIGDSLKNSNGKFVDFGQIYFTLDETKEIRFEYLRRHDPKLNVRLADILSPRWSARLTRLPRYKLRAVSHCRQQILSYRFHMVFMETNSLDEVRETFIRINSQGTPISAADRAFARASNFNLRHLVNEARTGLAHGFSDIAREPLLMAIALILGTRDVGERGVNSTFRKIENSKSERKTFDRAWRHIKKAIGYAVDYLVTHLGVLSFDYLPSQNMVATLALFFYSNDNARPNTVQRRELRKWFWATAVGQRYAGGGFRRNILADAAFFQRLGNNRTGRFDVKEKMPASLLRLTEYSKRSGITDAFFCLLALHRPRYIEEGDYIPLDAFSTSANRKDRHHIFPKGLLAKYSFASREYNSICNICFIVAQENQSIGNKRPLTYLAELKKRRHFASVMKSHLIPHHKESPLWGTKVRRAYRAFCQERLKIICKAFERQAGTRLFRWD